MLLFFTSLYAIHCCLKEKKYVSTMLWFSNDVQCIVCFLQWMSCYFNLNFFLANNSSPFLVYCLAVPGHSAQRRVDRGLSVHRSQRVTRPFFLCDLKGQDLGIVFSTVFNHFWTHFCRELTQHKRLHGNSNWWWSICQCGTKNATPMQNLWSLRLIKWCMANWKQIKGKLNLIA